MKTTTAPVGVSRHPILAPSRVSASHAFKARKIAPLGRILRPVGASGKSATVDVDEFSAPLKQALEKATSRHANCQNVRDALEAEAQAMNQMAAEAREVQAKAKLALMGAVSEVVDATRVHASAVEKLAEVQRRLEDARRMSAWAEMATAESEYEAASKYVDECAAKITELRRRMETLYDLAQGTEATAADADQAAAAAMKVAEAALKDEIDALGAVKDAQLAFIKSLSKMSGVKVPVAPKPLPAASNGAAAPAAAPAPAGMPSWAPAAAAVVGLGAAFYMFLQTGEGAGLKASIDHALHSAFGHVHLHGLEAGILEAVTLLIASCVCVPLVVNYLPGGSPVLGYLLAGAIVGPYALNLVQNVHALKHLAEMGVVFLLFNIGLELSIEKLLSMAKLVFGMGTMQVGGVKPGSLPGKERAMYRMG